MDAIRAGEVNAVDMCIHPETLRAQADIAEDAGYDQLAINLRRAAELTGVPQSEILSIYEALRPYRVGHDQLLALAARLEREYGATENARLVREAAEVYRARGLL
jgi:propanediol dehydratase small subunit